ncbi:MAG: hypothetical protein A2504_04955 [Bdellovibrionales bacterium RIFOXYD12_FULL_39_22]|nr:MAG: hypothetical protein A2385_06870 [Bdellovibrionales bacterium RIFOXYB1_FULL_39_21]OFZ41989.1 MAG: hypothetical protein A2485_08840 [Bdellovibrionales bacterium RIFOXYC12_FULL_39_17]OFZ50705.1 MAG: hypothetical protein A2404_05790 [Bdellovibrionales bacterium RIFOXYC1_FULL_39_130]OFZ76453.1 MAG: hypothetical protein A2451_09415 [Bdellovibrionales bacterium RIFOXYC2_FULL_39_8]OFZ77928.1 MAG: hypothetical protein A2560_00960 [Bdellovibrionales bacterium RIFOXYD1_FULL_39_84]OFZ93636.1 MAG:
MQKFKFLLLTILIANLFGICLAEDSLSNEPSCFENFPQKQNMIAILNRHARGFKIYISHDKKKRLIFTNTTNTKNKKTTVLAIGPNNWKEAKINCPLVATLSSPQKVILMSTSYIPPLEELNELNSVAGISNFNLINNPFFKEKNADNLEIGFPPNIEKILKINPDLLFAYRTSTPDIDGLNAISRAGIKVVEVAEFLEKSPLARAEWLIFWGAIYGKLELAQQRFLEIERRYLELQALANKQTKRPSVLIGNIQNSLWVAPGLASDLAQMIKDAGANYLLFDNTQASPALFPSEKILTLPSTINFWLPQNNWNSFAELSSESFYKILLAQKAPKIFNSTKIVNRHGGNDYYETALMRPDLLLADLIKIFHPKILSENTPLWFKELKDEHRK